MANQITGAIEHISTISERKSTDGTKTYYRREVIINARRYDPYTGQSTADNFIAMVVNGQDRCKELDTFKCGDIVTASFILDGRKYQKKDTGETAYFTSVNCYKLEKRPVKPSETPTPQQPPVAQSPAQQPPYEPFPHQPFEETQKNGEIPF